MLRWGGAAVVIVAVLIALAPTVLAPLVSARLSSETGAAVRIGWISWNPLAASATFHDVSIAPSAGGPAIVTIAAVHLNVALRRWLARDPTFERIVVDRPWIGLERTANGDFNLAALFRAASANGIAPRPDAPIAGASSERTIRIATLRVAGGSIRFRDETVAPILETSLHLDDAVAEDLTLARGGAMEFQLSVASRLESAPLTLDLRYRATGSDSDLQARLTARDASLSRTLLYVPVGWQKVAGWLDVDLGYRRRVAAGELATHALTGHATLRDVAIGEPWVDEPSVRAKRVRLAEIRVDLIARRTDVGNVKVQDFSALIARTEDGFHLPLAGSGRDAPGSQWQTSLDAVVLGRGEIVVRNILPGDEQVAVPVTRGRISFPRDEVAFAIETTVAGGVLELEGRAAESTRITFVLRALTLGELAARLALPVRFTDGRVDGELVATVDGGAVRYAGALTIRDAMSAAPDASRAEEVMAWKELTVALGESTFVPLQLHVTRLTLAWPYLMVHRGADGVFPMTLFAARSERERRRDDEKSWLRIDRGTIQGGRVEIYDTTVQPAFGTDLADLDTSFERLSTTPLRIDRIDVSGSIDELSPLRVNGTINAGDAAVGLAVERLRLAPLSRYLEPSLNYEVTTGVARLEAPIRVDRGELTATAELVLSRLALRRTGPDPVAQEIGVSLPVALTLMKDLRGDVRLTVPVHGNLASSEYRLGSLVGKAVRDALIGAVSTPIRLLGSIFRRDEETSFDLKPVPFAPASAELDREGDERIAQVARLLDHHPELRSVLIPAPSAADIVRIRDEAMIADLDRSPRTPAEDALLTFLRARRAGASPAPLTREVAAVLREREAAMPVSPARLAALAAARIAAVARRLTEAHAIGAARVQTETWEPTDSLLEGIPGVDVQLRGD